MDAAVEPSRKTVGDTQTPIYRRGNYPRVSFGTRLVYAGWLLVANGGWEHAHVLGFSKLRVCFNQAASCSFERVSTAGNEAYGTAVEAIFVQWLRQELQHVTMEIQR